MKVRELIAGAETKLSDAGIEDYKNDAWLLFEHVFQINRGKYFMIMNDDVEVLYKLTGTCDNCTGWEAETGNDNGKQSGNADLTVRFEEAVARRCARIPLQHITGYQEFMGLAFHVNEHVLTPRPETELLVEQALKVCECVAEELRSSEETVRVLDMCTGSGCIAISVKMLSKVPVQVAAVDLSEKALEVAKQNAKTLNCEIRFTQSDLFDKIGDETFDVIISNPPYICSSVIPTLMEEVRVHEPVMALDGFEDGLFFYRKISDEARKHLCKGGRILYEIGYDQGEAVKELLKGYGYSLVEVIKDYAGLDRMVTAIWKPEMEE